MTTVLHFRAASDRFAWGVSPNGPEGWFWRMLHKSKGACGRTGLTYLTARPHGGGDCTVNLHTDCTWCCRWLILLVTCLVDDLCCRWLIVLMAYLVDDLSGWWLTLLMTYLADDLSCRWLFFQMTYLADDLSCWLLFLLMSYLAEDLSCCHGNDEAYPGGTCNDDAVRAFNTCTRHGQSHEGNVRAYKWYSHLET